MLLLPTMKVENYVVVPHSTYGEDILLRLNGALGAGVSSVVPIAANLNDKGILAFFTQFTEVKRQSDPSYTIEIHGEELTLFVNSGGWNAR